MKSILYIVCLSFISVYALASTETNDLDFDDAPLSQNLSHPKWFKKSSGDLRDDLQDALDANKKGLIIYFGQNRCSYCEQFIKNSLNSSDIEYYTRKNYDFINIDIWSSMDIIDTDGKEYTERDLSIHYDTNFTPSLVFYDRKGKPIFRLRGYYPPYKFRAALKYVAEEFYLKEPFRDYLARAEQGLFFLSSGLNERDFFIEPPYDLKTIINKNKQPLMVSFEQGNCHACDLLHSSPLNQKETLDQIDKITSVQLDMWSDTKVITPDGYTTTAKDWAKQLGLFHAPTLIFFDTNGKEIIRIDSIVKFYRLLGVLRYINQGGYLTDRNYQSWQLKQRQTK
ncbi:MAG: thioredoxin fold domain-containing protein [Gammaproteobacteria bacterium]|nr:thioredoxin fold domain-containing protein [Gammaproteobacteria bacterium]